MSPLKGLYASVGKMMPSGRKAGKEAFDAARRAHLPVGRRGGPTMKETALDRLTRARAARSSAYVQAGKMPTRIGLGVGTLGMTTAMRPNADQSRTSYRGPMQTGRGSGRYA